MKRGKNRNTATLLEDSHVDLTRRCIYDLQCFEAVLVRTVRASRTISSDRGWRDNNLLTATWSEESTNGIGYLARWWEMLKAPSTKSAAIRISIAFLGVFAYLCGRGSCTSRVDAIDVRKLPALEAAIGEGFVKTFSLGDCRPIDASGGGDN
jgi:hypothetical protein